MSRVSPHRPSPTEGATLSEPAVTVAPSVSPHRATPPDRTLAEAMPDPMDCERCGQPHGGCKAHNRAGGPCGRDKTPGHEVCASHGSKNPKAQARVAREEAEAQAEELVASLWTSLDGADPIKDPVDRLARVATVLESGIDFLGERIEGMKSIATGDSLHQLRAEVTLWEKLVGQLIRVLDSLAKWQSAQLDRDIRFDRDTADWLLTANAAGCRAVGLTREQELVFQAAFVGALRPVMGPGVVPGELEGGES